MTSKEIDEYITVEELAQRLKVSKRTIQRIVERREMPAVKIGRQFRFKREWVNRWLDKNTTRSVDDSDDSQGAASA